MTVLERRLRNVADQGIFSSETMISDDAIGNSKAAYNYSYESDRDLRSLCPGGFHFHPFRKLVNGDDQILISPHCPGEVAHNV